MKCTKAYRLEFTERAQKMVNSLTLEEKVSLMSGTMSLAQEMENMKEDPDNLY